MSRTAAIGLQDRIIEAAMVVFGEKGLQAATLKDIAAKADISTGTVYTYFQDKEALFAAAFDSGWQRFCVDIEELETRDESFERKIDALLGKGLEALAATLPSLRGMLLDASRLGQLQPAIERVIDAIDRIIEPYFVCETAEAEIEGRAGRRSIISIFVTGILFSATIGDPRRPEDIIAELRLATGTFFSLLDIHKNRSETT